MTQLARPERPEVNDPEVVHGATGVLAEMNRAGVLGAAEVHVAQRLDRLAGETDPSVLLAAAMAVRAVRQGAVCVDLERVGEVAPDLPWPAPEAWLDAVLASPLVTRDEVLHLDGDRLYLDRYWREESLVVDVLQQRAVAPPPTVDEARLEAELTRLFPDLQYADQRAAAGLACRRWTTVITGGPGTGKTTTIARMLAALLSLHDGDRPLRVALAAPTGKAAARVTQALQGAAADPGFPAEHREALATLGGTTLHRLLGAQAGHRARFRHDRGNPLPHDVVVVDETSMMSLSMTARLLEALRPGTRLVLVGDADQLTSVEAGAVLKDLVEGYGDAPGSPVARLDASRRFGEHIGALAAAVRDGDADRTVELLGPEQSEPGTVPGDGDLVVRVDEGALTQVLRDRVVELARSAADDPKSAVDALGVHRLLCAHRAGPAGVTTWNRRVERLLMDHLGVDWLPEWYVGRSLIVNANDYGLRLFNGDTAVVVADPEAPSGLVARVDDGADPAGRPLPVVRLSDVTTAHAMTVHRTQGSQFEQVSLVLPEAESRILTRELLYTGITRAGRVVRVHGSDDAVRAAVARRAQRATGLASRLQANR